MVARLSEDGDDEKRVSLEAAMDRFLRLAREKMKALDIVERLRRDDTAGWLRRNLFDPLQNIGLAEAERSIFQRGKNEIRCPKT